MNRRYEDEVQNQAQNQEPQQQQQEPEHEQVIQRLRSQSATPVSPELEDALRTGGVERLNLQAGNFWNLFQTFGPVLVTILNKLLEGSGNKPASEQEVSQRRDDEGG